MVVNFAVEDDPDGSILVADELWRTRSPQQFRTFSASALRNTRYFVGKYLTRQDTYIESRSSFGS
jgi:hypothetical protein